MESPEFAAGVRSQGANGGGPIKRKRSTLDSSPASLADHDHDHDQDIDHDERTDASPDTKSRRLPGVKRACNECRQQKLECKIESNFKRIGKRSKHAEMEKEIERLRRAVQIAKSQGFTFDEDDELANSAMQSQLHSPVVASQYTHTRNPSLIGSEEAVSSLLHLKRGGSYAMPRIARELDDFRLTEDEESQLFSQFFNYYHPFLPFLNPAQTPDQYYQQHPLLYWSIAAVASRRFGLDSNILTRLSGPLTRLLWATVGDVPQSYFVVKALCLLCTWPLPTSTTSSDPTHILCGVMMKTATGIGLHRPNHINDFSRVAVELNKEGLHDRIKTWAVCNIVAQTIGTGYGQPASTLYDWTLAIRPGVEGPYSLGPELEARLQIERFCDKVSKEMYSNASDPRGVAGDEHRAMLMRVYRREFNELQASIVAQNLSPIVYLHLKAACLHLRLAGFFDSSRTPGYLDDLMALWRATTSYLDYILDGPETCPEAYQYQLRDQFLLKYATNYIQQMLVAAGFALLKLMRSFFVKQVEFERGRSLFHRTIQAIRTTSVVHNDLNWRLAELMVQIWNGARIEGKSPSFQGDDPEIDDSLQLKVRCRHSMSLVFDSIWHWREEYQARGRGTLDASSTHLDSTLAPASQGLTANLGLATSNGALTPSGGSAVGGGTQNSLMGMNYDSTYDFWDPQHWMLDGLLDFNYTFVPIESNT
ncbi:f9278cce-edaf-4504-a00d-786cd4b006d9 [Thermothielavioides terrestris]|uniref:F9278cce-edaf-4504-a00d-786cd4b006d9 n=1 Tax=Thermothielavioides terrestris TaxID=2587410 RepID=A0A446B683_9PEZI|nr:f9278cce-edaf-4504-a00d-786cd4b006d9 [Thermothielavioides terrestris]